MADIVKFFYEYGKFYQKDLEKSFNQIYDKKIDYVAVIDIPSYKFNIYDFSTVKDRLFLYVISSNSGNLFPFVIIADKIFDREENGKIKTGGLRKSISNLEKYIKDEDKDEFSKIKAFVDFDKIKEIVNGIQKEPKKQYYLALSYDGKFFNELYGYAVNEFLSSKKKFMPYKGVCFIENNESEIGFDAELNFCSVNEMPSALGKILKPKLLSLSSNAGEIVKLGFNKAFNECNFRLMGMPYILIATVFGDDDLKQEVFELIKDSKKIDKGGSALHQRKLLEEDLEEIIKEVCNRSYDESMLFSFLFYSKNNKEIVLYQTIEDIAPSRIKKVSELLNRFDIDVSNLSKYYKKAFRDKNPDLISLRDYINNRLTIAKLLFGKEKLTNNFILHSIALKILKGDNQKEENNRELSKVISGYYKNDTDFSRHQRVADFLYSIDACDNICLGGEGVNFESLKDLIDWKFENVDLMKNNNIGKEFYLLGMMVQHVIRTQKSRNADNDFKSSLENYIDSAGLINMINRNRVFSKTIDGAKKYKVYGDDWDYLLSQYSNIKSTEKLDEKMSIDTANILFVMGSIDYKNLKKKGE